MHRFRDGVWISGSLIVLVGFGSVAIAGFVWPVKKSPGGDGRCRIGLRGPISVSLLTFDISINVALTLIFIYLLRPLLQSDNFSIGQWARGWLPRCIGQISTRSPGTPTIHLRRSNQNQVKMIESLLWKTFFGSLLVMTPTVANLLALAVIKHGELGWICLAACTLDGNE